MKYCFSDLPYILYLDDDTVTVTIDSKDYILELLSDNHYYEDNELYICLRTKGENLLYINYRNIIVFIYLDILQYAVNNRQKGIIDIDINNVIALVFRNIYKKLAKPLLYGSMTKSARNKYIDNVSSEIGFEAYTQV